MAQPAQRPASRYRRRILGLGALATFALYVIGAPIVNNRIEDDLEERVPDELADAGFTGVSARFSGQDGTLDCEQPLDDPEVAIETAYDVRGVRAIELDRSCRVNAAPSATTTTTLAPDTAGDTSPEPTTPDATDSTEPSESTVAPAATTTVPPDFATVADIVGTDPQFALLSVLAQESGLAATLAAPEPITLFAPTDAAFDGVAADVIAQLRAEPELLNRVLSHHIVPGRFGSAELSAGPVDTADGGSIEIGVVGDAITINDASVVDRDIAAGNGVVHVIDRLLVPADLDLSAPEPLAETSATFADGAVTFEGIVASEVERAVLVAAATTAVGADNIVDELEVDPDVGLDAATAASLAELVVAMPENLLGGVSRFDGSELRVTGTYVGDAERDAMLAAADAAGAMADLTERPDATESDAVDLEAELNAFVADNPILFEPNASVLSPSAFAIIDRVALEAQRFGGVSITVEGHTDSDGVPIENVILSGLRANAVRDALIERGIDAASIDAEGFGSEQPVLVGGAEDKNASRRVEFRVVATS